MEAIGLQKVKRKYNRLSNAINKAIIEQLGLEAVNLKRKVMTKKRYHRQSGNLDKAITAKVDKKGRMLKFYINDRMVTTSSRKSYGVFVHEGTGRGYKKSKSASLYPSNKGIKGKKYDHFMDTTFFGELKKIKKNMKNIIKKVLKG